MTSAKEGEGIMRLKLLDIVEGSGCQDFSHLSPLLKFYLRNVGKELKWMHKVPMEIAK